MSNFDVPLWPVGSSAPAETSDRRKIREHHLFPSGRAALTTALFLNGFGREDLIWVPPFSSHCVLSAVSQVARPTSEIGHLISAAVVYEQWGWAFPKGAQEDLARLSRSSKIIIDSVDTPLTADSLRVYDHFQLSDFRVWSLGKTLGAIGGGLLTDGGGNFHPPKQKQAVRVEINQDFLSKITSIGMDPVDFFRQNSSRPSREITEMTRSRVLESALNREESNRRRNLDAIAVSGLTRDWSPWMFSFLEAGGAPGIAPLGIGRGDKELQKIRQLLAKKLAIEASVYHFNSSGHPLRPNFKKCLAVPTHSQATSEKTHEMVGELSKALSG